MDFKLVFENTGDEIPFTVIENQQLFEYFVDHVNTKRFGDLCNSSSITKTIKLLINAIDQVNNTVKILSGINFKKFDNDIGYLDQNFLNSTHCDWVHSQDCVVNIDVLRTSDNLQLAEIGSKLHDCYPDDIRNIRLAEVLSKLGLFNHYTDINDKGIHTIEESFDNIFYCTDNRYDMFENLFFDETVTSNSYTNFSFSYIYLGRKYYDKFANLDEELQYDDHYNFEKLEETFSLSLKRPETIPFSKEFLDWANKHGVKPMGMRVPIANIPDYIENLTKYRTIVYNNSIHKNKCKIEV